MEVIFLRQAHEYIQKAEYGLYLKIEQEIEKIQKNPNTGKRFSGRLCHFLVHRFFYKRSQYRIAYRIEKNIIIVMTAGRENFYKKLGK